MLYPKHPVLNIWNVWPNKVCIYLFSNKSSDFYLKERSVDNLFLVAKLNGNGKSQYYWPDIGRIPNDPDLIRALEMSQRYINLL